MTEGMQHLSSKPSTKIRWKPKSCFPASYFVAASRSNYFQYTGIAEMGRLGYTNNLPDPNHYRFNIFRGTANIFRSFFISSRLSTHVGKAPNYSGVSQSARLKHGIITARCNLATGRSRRTAILHLSSQRCGPTGGDGSACACTVYKL